MAKKKSIHESDKKDTYKKQTATGCGCVFFVILIIIGLVASCGDHDDKTDKNLKHSTSSTTSNTTETSSGKAHGVSKMIAEVECQNAVTQNLRNPDSAKFHNLAPNAWKSEPVENGYKVESYVDAKNGFGGTVRTGFGCTVTQDPGEKNPTTTIDWMD